jgi:hypothetical protein
VKQLESQATTKGGLTGLIANGILGEGGVKAERLLNLRGTHGNALEVHACLSLRAVEGNRVALSLSLSQPQLREWSIKEIFLVDGHGGVFKPMTWLGEGPIPPGNVRQSVILEWQLKGSEVARAFTLVVVGNDGRSVRVGRIVFPQ